MFSIAQSLQTDGVQLQAEPYCLELVYLSGKYQIKLGDMYLQLETRHESYQLENLLLVSMVYIL